MRSPARINLGELLHQCTSAYADRDCLIQAESGETLSYRELEQRVNRLAHGLIDEFPETSAYIGIMLENSIDYLALTYALKKTCHIEVSINRAFRGAALCRMINLTQCDLLVTSAAHFDALEFVREDLPYLRSLVITDDVEEAAERFPDLAVRHLTDIVSDKDHHLHSAASDLDVTSIMFTSGTTGTSKGCELSHRYAIRTAENMIAPFRLTADDIAYTPYPLSHIGPAYYDILPMLMVGGQAVIRDGFSLSAFWPEVARYGVTWFMCLGSVQQLLYAAPPCKEERQHKVTRCWSTPAPVAKADFDARFGLHLIPGGGYGSTDAGWVVAPQWDHPGGKVLPHFSIAIVDENDDPVPPGTEGELVIRPQEPGVMSDGYFGMPDKTMESRRNLWFHTGDIAYIDSEGLFYFRCRMVERIRIRGEMVSAQEVEEGVLRHPGIEDAAVIPFPSPLGEEDIHAFITLKEGESLLTEELREHCKIHLAKFMVPAVFTILDAMPRTPTGKPEKGVLRGMLVSEKEHQIRKI